MNIDDFLNAVFDGLEEALNDDPYTEKISKSELLRKKLETDLSYLWTKDGKRELEEVLDSIRNLEDEDFMPLAGMLAQSLKDPSIVGIFAVLGTSSRDLVRDLTN